MPLHARALSGLGSGRTRAVAVLIAFLTGVVGAGVYLAVTGVKTERTATRPPAELRPFVAIFDPSSPLLISGARVSKEEASSRAGYEVVEPSWLPASVESRTPEIWFAAVTNEAGLRYGSQLVLTFREWPPGMDPLLTYDTQARDWNAGSTTTLGSHPAWIIPENAQAPGAPPVSVIHVSRGKVDITLYGIMPIEDLKEVAQSLPE